VPVVQSVFVPHLLHAPLAAQYGAIALGHAFARPDALSPPHAMHACVVALQTGVFPVHAVEFVPLHCTHAFAVVSHAGVAPAHVVSATHPTHLFMFAPVVAQTIDLHTVPPFPALHGIP